MKKNPFEDVRKFIKVGDENVQQLKKKQKPAFNPRYYNRRMRQIKRVM